MARFDVTPEELLVGLCNGEFKHIRGVLEKTDGLGYVIGNCCLGVYCRLSGVPVSMGDTTLVFSPIEDEEAWKHPRARLPEGHWLSDPVHREDKDGWNTYDGGLDGVLMHFNDERNDVGYDLAIQVLCYYLAGEPIPMKLEPLVPVNR